MTIRERTEKMEQETLSSKACLASNSKGRKKPEEPCPMRTAFQRDRDRILHCNAFKRLRNKTQVFLSPRHDHYRTRLIHSLEVAQIARTVARGLRLNEDLAEAIALGHDLGHAPFGHAGERALDEVCPEGFLHAQNSVRVVEEIELNGKGLNLSWEVLDGISYHSAGKAHTLEGRLVQICDKVAYVNHDIEDAVRAEMLQNHDLPQQCVYILGDTKSKRISTIVNSLIENSVDDIQMNPDVAEAHSQLRKFMFKHVYESEQAQNEQQKAEHIVKELYRYFKKYPSKMPEFFWQISEEKGLDRGVCDYIAGMSDKYVVDLYTEIFLPKPWDL